jgi:hypothetical protein
MLEIYQIFPAAREPKPPLHPAGAAGYWVKSAIPLRVYQPLGHELSDVGLEIKSNTRLRGF